MIFFISVLKFVVPKIAKHGAISSNETLIANFIRLDAYLQQ
jgi:hypothetical protein